MYTPIEIEISSTQSIRISTDSFKYFCIFGIHCCFSSQKTLHRTYCACETGYVVTYLESGDKNKVKFTGD